GPHVLKGHLLPLEGLALFPERPVSATTATSLWRSSPFCCSSAALRRCSSALCPSASRALSSSAVRRRCSSAACASASWAFSSAAALWTSRSPAPRASSSSSDRCRASRSAIFVLASMFLSTSSALCCPSWLIWEYSRFISTLFWHEISLSCCKGGWRGEDAQKLKPIRAISGGKYLPG